MLRAFEQPAQPKVANLGGVAGRCTRVEAHQNVGTAQVCMVGGNAWTRKELYMWSHGRETERAKTGWQGRKKASE